MGTKITQKDFEERVETLSKGRFKLISEYRGKNTAIKLLCKVHNTEFEGRGDWFCHGDDVRGNCPICAKEARDKRYSSHREKVKCALCGETIVRPKGHLRAKSGMYFCCAEHMAQAQKKDSGEHFKSIRPLRYAPCDEATVNTYRKRALEYYGRKCSVCEYDEDPDILEVHHIDEDRSHNKLPNLIVLCPMCHKKLTTHNYQLIGRTRIIRLQLKDLSTQQSAFFVCFLHSSIVPSFFSKHKTTFASFHWHGGKRKGGAERREKASRQNEK